MRSWINSTAFQFVILLGLVSLFADVTYEGARSISGQFLSQLGANATVVATISGLGELIGYGVRLISGYISDKTKRYWAITISGYVINLLAVPLLAFANHWSTAALLLIFERLGKAIRTPARDAMLSYATKEMGRGRGFGIHMALDQAGAIAGPLLIMASFYTYRSYLISFALLGIPALIALAILGYAQRLFPQPQNLEIITPSTEKKGLTRTYWLYMGAVSLVAAGYVDFPLIAYHFEKQKTVPEVWIPLFYAAAMGAGGLSALCFGWLYDKLGISILMAAIFISLLFAPLVFLGGVYLSFLGAVLWGVGLGAQGSVMRAVIATLVQKEKRGTAYGILNTGFGVAWFLGSVIIGLLYEFSIPLLIAFSVATQFASLPIIFSIRRSVVA